MVVARWWRCAPSLSTAWRARLLTSLRYMRHTAFSRRLQVQCRTGIADAPTYFFGRVD